MGRKHLLTVASGDPLGIENFLVARLAVTRAVAKRWLARGAVQAGAARADPRTPLALGTRVVVREPPPDRTPLALPIVHHDGDLLVVDKPAGLLSQPAAGESTSLEALVTRDHPEARLAHRIDRDASGLVMFTLNPIAHGKIQHGLGDGSVTREYLAVCGGVLEGDREIRLRIAPEPDHPSLRRALPESSSGGQPARTRVHPLGPALDVDTPSTLLLVTLDTGRTHQIRVHLAAEGHPLIGDRLYGGVVAPRLLLHASRLALLHPRSGERLELTSPAPPGFRA